MKNEDLVSRQAVKDIFTELYGISAIGSVFDKYEWADICETTANELPSAEPDIIRCKDCKYLCNEDGLRGMCWHINGFGTDIKDKYNSFCSWAERREDATD